MNYVGSTGEEDKGNIMTNDMRAILGVAASAQTELSGAIKDGEIESEVIGLLNTRFWKEISILLPKTLYDVIRAFNPVLAIAGIFGMASLDEVVAAIKSGILNSYGVSKGNPPKEGSRLVLTYNPSTGQFVIVIEGTIEGTRDSDKTKIKKPFLIVIKGRVKKQPDKPISGKDVLIDEVKRHR